MKTIRSFIFRIDATDWHVDPKTLIRELTTEVQVNCEQIHTFRQVVRPEDFESFLDVYFRMAKAALLEEMSKSK